MENDLEIMAASPLWDSLSTNDIPTEYRILAILSIIAPHIEASPKSHTILALWVKGIPIILDFETDPVPDGPSPIDIALKVA